MTLVVTGSSDLAAGVARGQRQLGTHRRATRTSWLLRGRVGWLSSSNMLWYTAARLAACRAACLAAPRSALPPNLAHQRTRKEHSGHLQLDVHIRHSKGGSQPQRCQPRRFGAVVLAAAGPGREGQLAQGTPPTWGPQPPCCPRACKTGQLEQCSNNPVDHHRSVT